MPYPDWVLKHKKKGTYVNCVKGKYYLYAAHSERVPGTKKVKRICDGYLGRITEDEGLIPPKDKVSSKIEVYEYGLTYSLLQLCQNIHNGFKKTSPRNANLIMVCAILNIVYGCSNETLFNRTYLSKLYPRINVNKAPSDTLKTHIERGILMIEDQLKQIMGDEREHVFQLLAGIYKIHLNNKWYLSSESESVSKIKEKYNLNWEENNA